jgi:hypothetical protein
VNEPAFLELFMHSALRTLFGKGERGLHLVEQHAERRLRAVERADRDVILERHDHVRRVGRDRELVVGGGGE